MGHYINAIIINWNGTADTIELVDSLIAEHSDELTIDVYIVDNGSSKDELRKLQDYIKEKSSVIYIYLIANTSNQGVPKAYNQAICAARNKSAAYLRLDNDVVINPGGLHLLSAAMADNWDTGVRIVGCNTRFYTDRSQNDSGASYFNLLTGQNRRIFPDRDVICDGVQGCVMLIDSTVVSFFSPEVFDSWLFIMTDESELSIKAAQLGWKTLYIHQPVALHKAGMSSGKIGGLLVFYAVRNWSFISLKYGCSNLYNSFFIHIRLIMTVIYHILKPKHDALRFLKVKAIAQGIQRRYKL